MNKPKHGDLVWGLGETCFIKRSEYRYISRLVRSDEVVQLRIAINGLESIRDADPGTTFRSLAAVILSDIGTTVTVERSEG